MKVVFLFPLFLFLTACSPSNGDQPSQAVNEENTTPNNQMSLEQQKQAIVQLEETGQLPKLDRTDSLTGIDQDQNGVRDDIDAYINQLSLRLSLSDFQKKLLINHAANYQEVLRVEHTKETAKENINNYSKSLGCLSKYFSWDYSENPTLISKKIRDYTYNTKQRMIHYLKYNKLLDGTVTSYTSEVDCND